MGMCVIDNRGKDVHLGMYLDTSCRSALAKTNSNSLELGWRNFVERMPDDSRVKGADFDITKMLCWETGKAPQWIVPRRDWKMVLR